MTEFQEAPRETTGVKAAAEDGDGLQVPAERKALVEQWLRRIKAAKKHFDGDFKRMDECMQLAAEGADKEWVKSEKYVVPIINRHINQAVAQLYAKDPRAVASRRRRLMFKLWDGDPETFADAMLKTQPPAMPASGAQMPGMMTAPVVPWQPDPNAVALVQEVNAAIEYNRLIDRVGKSVEILWKYYTGEQANGFKQQMKALVRRTKVCGVGYVKLLFQRELKRHPEVGAQIDDVSSQIAAMEAAARQVAEGQVEEGSPKLEELRLLQQQLAPREYIVVREGPVFDFPRAKEIIVDPKCRHLKTFTGARWLAHEFKKTPEEILEDYKVDIKSRFTEHKPEVPSDGEEKPSSVALVYEVQDKKNGQCFTIVDGYPDFLKEPYDPDVKIERFWTVFSLVFNEIEHEDKLYPPSDVWLLRHPQAEMNRSREGLREHRIAARPKYAVPKGVLEREDKAKLEGGAAHAVVELKGLRPGQRIAELLQAVPVTPIDPNLYEVGQAYQDVQRSVGAQEANLGGTSDSSATESSIAENSRQASLADNVDDLDDLLTEMARATSQLCLMELTTETVMEIVGPGAAWPDLQGNREEIAKDLLLDIQAGSSGRPNKAANLANLERGMPYMIQIPGMNPKVLGEKYARELDFDTDELIVEGMPSIVAMNQMAGRAAAQPGTGDADTNPADQGGKGAQNAIGPGRNENEPQGQPAYPTTA